MTSWHSSRSHHTRHRSITPRSLLKKPDLQVCSRISKKFEDELFLVNPSQPIRSKDNGFVSSFISPSGQTYTSPGLTHDEIAHIANRRAIDLTKAGFIRVYRGDPGSWSGQNIFGVDVGTMPTEPQLAALQAQFDSYPSYIVHINMPGGPASSIAQLRKIINPDNVTW